jgi:ArsR family transcriptional regulator
MKNAARLFKALADETRLKILWLLMGQEELCVCDIMGVLGITQSKASRHLRYLFNAGLVTDRREGLWMYYRIAVAPGSREGKQLQVLREMLSGMPAARVLSQQLRQWLQEKSCRTQETEKAGVELQA